MSGRAAARAAVLACAAALAVTACGGEPGDIMLVHRTGTIPGARLDLRFTADGRVGCDREPLRQLTSAQTLQARDLQRRIAGKNADGPAAHHVHLPPGPGAILRYRVSMQAGDVAFSDTSRRQAQAFYGIAALTRAVARGVCGRTR